MCESCCLHIFIKNNTFCSFVCENEIVSFFYVHKFLDDFGSDICLSKNL